MSDGILPPREGLIPGTWKYRDPSRLGGIVDNPRPAARWSSRYVGMRMIEAHRVLARVPARIMPRQFGTSWPQFRQEAEPIDESDASVVEEHNHVVFGASAEDIARMSQAIEWPMQFLSGDVSAAQDVNLWASQMTVEEFEKIDDGAADVPWAGLSRIAAALNAARIVVR